MSRHPQTVAAVLFQIQDLLIAEAEEALSWAERYSKSNRQGERNSTPIYVRRGEIAMRAVKLLENELSIAWAGLSLD